MCVRFCSLSYISEMEDDYEDDYEYEIKIIRKDITFMALFIFCFFSVWTILAVIVIYHFW
jgi:hypothetical protein